MRTAQIAKIANVHPNTVRLYEEWGYISPVARLKNGYRQYTEIHVHQMLIARLAFKHEFIQNNLRKKATQLVLLSGAEKFNECLLAAHAYLQFLQSELDYAQLAVQTANELLQNELRSDEIFSHKQVAVRLQLTEETIRNWERNGLFTVSRNSQNRRQYSEADVQKLVVIRVLRSAHFSVASIAHLFQQIEQGTSLTDIHSLLNNSQFQQEFYHVTDELEHNLKKAIIDVQSIIAILKRLQ